MVRPRKLKDMVLHHLDKNPDVALTKFDALSNDELIDHIAKTVYTDYGRHGELSCSVPEDFEEMGELNQYHR